MWIIELLKGLPKELIVAITAASPIIEVRGSVPLGILQFGLPPFKNFLISVVGSLVPIFPILWILNFLTDGLRKIKIFDRFFEWLFTRTRAKSKLIEKYETLGLALFVSIPLPGTGVWTGCVAAYLFGLPWSNTILAATIGTSIAAAILTLASLGIINFF